MGAVPSTPSAAVTTDRGDTSLERELGTLSVAGESKPPLKAQSEPQRTKPRRGSGKVIPTRFDHPAYIRNPLSAETMSRIETYAVIERRRAGWAVELGLGQIISGRLENTGPFGDPHMLDGITPSALRIRAHLRAVIAALRYPSSAREGHKRLVICTPEPKILKRATILIRDWLSKGWLGPARYHGKPAATNSILPSTNNSKRRGSCNKKLPELHKTALPGASNRAPPPTVLDYDLWELLLGECERYKKKGLRIEFHYMERSHRKYYDHLRSEALAASRKKVCEDFEDV